MTINDKMGGFISARFIHKKDVQNFYIQNQRVFVNPNQGNKFHEIDFVKNGVSTNVTVSNENQGQLYDISATISLKSEFLHEIIPFNKVLLFLTNPLGDVFVFGTYNFPLTLSTYPEHAQNAAGYSGQVLSFKGKTTTSPLKLAVL